jgi:photosystem II stability/assembly factor-like uncharacterized protein
MREAQTIPDTSHQTSKRAAYIRTDLQLRDISAADQNHLWILADEGNADKIPYAIVLSTSDGGGSWKKQRIDPDGIYAAIHFVNDKVGWMAGAEGDESRKSLILKTTDGGTSWFRQRAPAKAFLVEIQFIDQECGWMMSDDGELLHTSDGGKTWRSRRLEGHGWVGRNFRAWLNSLNFVDKLNGWIVGAQKKAYQSTDGGFSWKSRGKELSDLILKSQKQDIDFLLVKFINRKVGFIIADIARSAPDGIVHRHELLRTENGGRTWIKVFDSEEFDFRDLSFINDNDGWMMSTRGRYLLRTRDGGKRWAELPGLPPEFDGGEGLPHELSGAVWGLRFVDSKNAWLFSNANDYPIFDNLLRTTDGGRTWFKQKLPVEKN